MAAMVDRQAVGHGVGSQVHTVVGQTDEILAQETNRRIPLAASSAALLTMAACQSQRSAVDTDAVRAALDAAG